MPLFFFDCFTGPERHTDAFGVDLEIFEVPDQAMAIAHDLLGEQLREIAPGPVAVVVRDSDNRRIYRAQCSFDASWLVPTDEVAPPQTPSAGEVEPRRRAARP